MNPYPIPFIIGHSQTPHFICSRFLPPHTKDVAIKWLQSKGIYGKSTISDGFILDPFGSSPQLLSELANSGYRVLTTTNNPILRFLSEIFANPPEKNFLTSLFAEFVRTRKGDERLELHLRSLYQSRCQECDQPLEVDAFIWERNSPHDKPILTGKIYHCNNCTSTGEQEASHEDILIASKYSSNSPYYSRCIERIVSLNDPDRQQIEDSMQIYLPRALYVINTLLNIRDTLALDNNSTKALELLLLVAFEYGNSLWGLPISRARPRQLITPPRFRENNIWISLESFIKEWTGTSIYTNKPITYTFWPDLPTENGGVCIYAGRTRDIIKELKNIPIKTILAPIPRPNQAFWMLSAIWSGWLWGKELVKPLKPILRRKRFDWGWHTSALYSAFRNIRDILQTDTNCLGLIGESEPGFIASTLLASDIAGLTLQGLAIRPDSDDAQIHWQYSFTNNNNENYEELSKFDIKNIKYEKGKFPNEFEHKVCSSIQTSFRKHGEPLFFSQIHALAITSIINTKIYLPDFSKNHESFSKFCYKQSMSLMEIFNMANMFIEKTLTFRNGFIRLGGSDKALDIGQWWIREELIKEKPSEDPLSDRVEKIIVNFLLKEKPKTLLEIDQMVCDKYTGIHTPSSELIQVCLESYGKVIDPGNLKWQLREEDIPHTRNTELQNISQLLKRIAHRLQYTSEGEKPILWKDSSGSIIYVIYIIASAIFSDIVLNPEYTSEQSIILLPGGRANLVAYKLNHNIRLQEAINKGWRFIKFRQIRALEESAVLYPEFFNEQLSLDKLTYSTPQMRLF